MTEPHTTEAFAVLIADGGAHLREWVKAMAERCGICGKMVRKYKKYHGTVVCFDPDCIAVILEDYLLLMEKRRKTAEQYNQLSFQQAREMSAWLSIYKFGNKEAKARAAKILQVWF